MSERGRGSAWAALGVVAVAGVVGCGAEPPPSQTPRAREPRQATGDTPSVGTRVVEVAHSEPPSPTEVFEEPVAAAGMATIIATSDGAYAATDPDRDSLWLTLADRPGVRRVRFERGALPSRVAEDGEGALHVVLRGAGAIAHVDAISGVELARTAVCANPRGVAAWPGTSRLFVACEDGTLARFDWRASDRALLTRKIERDLRDVVVSGGSLWVSTFRTAHVQRLSDELELLEKYEIPTMRIDVTDGRWSASVAWRMIAMRDGGVALSFQYANSGALRVSPFSPAVPVYYGEGASGCDSLVNSAIAVFKANEAPRYSSALNAMPLMVDIADRVVAGEPTIAVLSLSNAIVGRDSAENAAVTALGHLAQRSIVAAPSATVGCGRASDVYATLGGEAVALTQAHGGGLAVLVRDPAGIYMVPRGLTSGFVAFAGAEPRQNTGYQVFHGALPAQRSAPLACASCHPEGGDDGRVWRFPTGARRTQSLAGALEGTAPYHWDGDLSTLNGLVTEVWSRRMGMPALEPAQSRAIARWLGTLRTSRDEPVASPESVARGRALFESPAVQCASCHSGAMLTNNETMDVGTQGRFQVPPLRGLRRRAPLMHDGCAATLLDRFTDERCGGGDRHGHTSQLDQDQLADLVAYLETL